MKTTAGRPPNPYATSLTKPQYRQQRVPDKRDKARCKQARWDIEHDNRD